MYMNVCLLMHACTLCTDLVPKESIASSGTGVPCVCEVYHGRESWVTCKGKTYSLLLVNLSRPSNFIFNIPVEKEKQRIKKFSHKRNVIYNMLNL